MTEVYITGGCKTIANEFATISVKLELTEVYDGKSKKKITIYYKGKYGILEEFVLTPKRSKNTSQALASQLANWFINNQRIEFGMANKLAWALARKFEYNY